MIGAKNREFFEFGSSYQSGALLGVGGVVTIVSPAANTNGILLHRTEFVTEGNTNAGFLTKTSAPTNATDGDMVCGISGFSLNNTLRVYFGKAERTVKIPAGKGLYFYSGAAEQNFAQRAALYSLI
jgi:hypothetical protein